MPKTKSKKEEIETAEEITPPVEIQVEPELEAPEMPPDRFVAVRNQGASFPCDLTAYGYGMRWPTGAVYKIPSSKYMELLKQGLDGVGA